MLRKVASLKAALVKKEQQIATAQSKGATKPLGARELETLAGWRAKAEEIFEDIEHASDVTAPTPRPRQAVERSSVNVTAVRHTCRR